MGDVLKLSIQSFYDSLDRVVGLVEKAAKKSGISEEDEADLMISVMEAVNNAIQHGNREDETKQVHIRMETASGKIAVCVKDEGEGFNVASVPDPRDPENLLNVSGRGILMMKAFMDRVEFPLEDRGTLVRMTKEFGQNQK